MPINITITADFICPWCLIGEQRLARAIEKLPAGADVQRHWQPFELNPGMPPEGISRKTYRTMKFGSWERSLMLDQHSVMAAREDGVVFNYDAIEKTPNTFRAHRLMRLAARHGHADALAGALFRAYFQQGRDIGDPAVLADIASEVGLERTAAAAFLASDEEAEPVRNAEQAMMRRGIEGVPAFDIDGEAIYGAQPAASFVDVLQRAFQRTTARAG